MITLPFILKTQRFLPLFVTQFLGACNDNVFKNALVMFVTYRLSTQTHMDASLLVTLAGALFMLPFFLFSATAGQLADRYDRARIARFSKVWEIVLVGIGSLGFWWGSPYFLLAVLFGLGVQATFFGPVKYALLPQHLREGELLSGNSLIEAGTFLAILFGTIVGGQLIMAQAGVAWVCALMLAFAGFGYAASRFIPDAPAPMPNLAIDWNILRATRNMLRMDRKNLRVWYCILGISWFWLVGATFLAQFPTFTKDILHSDETVVTLLLSVFSVGIGVGSLLANSLLKGDISVRFVPWAACGISVFGVDVFFASNADFAGVGGVLSGAWQWLDHAAAWRILADLFGIALCGGVYIVPLYAVLQHDSDPAFRARTIASNNVLNALFMVASALASMLMLAMGCGIAQIFLVTACANALIALKALRLRSVFE